MTLLIKPIAATKLSQLTIDVDKDWQAKAVTNLKGLAAGCTQGDIFFRGASVIQRLAPGIAGQFLVTKGVGANPEWGDYAGRVERIFFLSVSIPTKGQTATAANVPGVSSELSRIVQTPGQTLTTPCLSPLACGGAVYHDDAPPTDTDETTPSNNATANDMHLLPSPSAVGDGFYFGLDTPFDWVAINIGTAGAGTWTITWKYWNSTTWTALILKYDETANWRTTGLKRVHFNRPLDWATTTIAGIADKYWVKAEVTAYTSMTTQPLGTQAWIGQY